MKQEEIDQKINKIDATTKELRLSALEFLQLVHAEFPLKEVMPPDFKGSHSLTLFSDGRLCLTVWCDDHCYPFIFD